MQLTAFSRECLAIRGILPKTLRAMQLTAVLLLGLCLQTAATGMSQTITFSGADVPLEKVFSTIKQQTGYFVSYKARQVRKAKPVTIYGENMPLETFLNQALKNQPFEFTIEVNTIFIKEKEEKYLQAIIQPISGALSPVDISLSGRVTNTNNEPLEGVSVTVKGTQAGTATNADGRFQLTVPSANNIELVFSFVGYATQTIKAGGQTAFNIVMEEAVSDLSNVVVVGYGAKQNKATVTGSVVSVNGKEVEKSPVTNVSNALAGRLPGVVLVQRSGEPGNDGSFIRIRGVNTLGNNSALVVIDGVPGRSLERIDPNTIENITVLKDASAAIYGSQAANGVILITTKRGKAGKAEVTLNANQGFNQPTRLPKMASSAEYATMLNELDLYNGRAPRYAAEEIQKFRDGSDIWRYPNTDWFAEVLKPWSRQHYMNGSLSGGTDKMRYFLSLGTKFQDGYYYHSSTNYKQHDFRLNIDGKISESISISADVSGRMENRNLSSQTTSNIFTGILRSSPGKHAYWPDGSPGPDIEGGVNPAIISTDAAGYNQDRLNVLNTNIRLDIKLPWVAGLSFTGNASLDKIFNFRKKFDKPWYLYSWDNQSYDADGKPLLIKGKKGYEDPRLTEYAGQQQTVLTNGYFTYSKSFGDHEFKGMVGAEALSGMGNNFQAFRRYFISSTLDQLFAGGDAEKDNSGVGYQNARLNYFGRLNYNYRDKYLAEFVARYDGSYIFPKASRYGFFPGLSLGWIISEEDFWQNNLSFIDKFKLRASWGQTGNDRIDEWQYLSSYAFDRGGNTYIFADDEQNKLLFEERVPNPNVTWEVANQANIGIEGSLLNNRLSFEFDYFNYKRSKILWRRNASVPTSTGLTLPRENIGKVSNKGFEFNLNYQSVYNTAFRYSIGLNGGYSKNKITFWDESPGRPDYQQSTGKPIPSDPQNPDGDLYYEAIGIFRDEADVNKYPHWTGARPGDIIFKDVNGDNQIDGNDRVRNDKSNIPRFTGGLSLSLGFGQFDLSMLFQGAAGAVRYIATYSGDSGNFLKDFYDNRWTTENPDSKGPRSFNRAQEYWRNNNNTYFLYSTDYVRLKNVVFSYTLPAKLVAKMRANNLRVYLSGYNLLTLSPGLKDFDPESVDPMGISYPVQRVINGGITLTF